MLEHSFQDFVIQGQDVSAVSELIEHGKMTHALLITGEPGVGKKTLAYLTAQLLLCGSQGEKPCGICDDCILFASEEHPDLVKVEKGSPLSEVAKKGRSTIPVDDIREIIRICSRYPARGGNRVILISDAEDMTTQAQNCLLKILEEPPQNNYFLLTSSHPDQLLVTIRSRCRPLKLKPWPDEYIRKILMKLGVEAGKSDRIVHAASGSAGKAKSLAFDEEYWNMRDEIHRDFFCIRERSDILRISGSLKEKKMDADQFLEVLEDDLRTLLFMRLHLYGETPPEDFPPEWIRFAKETPIERFSVLQSSIREARRQLEFNVSVQAVAEQLLLALIGEKERWAV